MINQNLSVNALGHLVIGGVDTVEIAEKYGTPTYVIDEAAVRARIAEFRDSLNNYYNGNSLCLYASKALCCMELCRILASEGVGIDVVSGGEIYTAYKSGFPMERVYFHGNNKTADEINLAIDTGVGRFVVDNINELNMLSLLCAQKGKACDILLRIKPGVDAHTHSFVRTGQIDSKFGFALETGEAFEAVKAALSSDNIKLVGLHCHIASQVFETSPFVEAAEVMLGFIEKIKTELGYDISELDLGGGFGVPYIEGDAQVSYKDFMEPVAKRVLEICTSKQLKTPKILIEPGRAVIAEAGITLYTVGVVKNIPNIRTYVSVDGGMGDNPRYILYGSDYTAECASKANMPKSISVTIAGKCCESGDIIQENAPLQEVESGDILAVLSTGAYNYSMASNYNRIPRPPVVIVNNGECRVAVRRETWDDVIALDN